MIFPNLKPSTQTISIRLPEDLLVEIKVLANKREGMIEFHILRSSLNQPAANVYTRKHDLFCMD